MYFSSLVPRPTINPNCLRTSRYCFLSPPSHPERNFHPIGVRSIHRALPSRQSLDYFPSSSTQRVVMSKRQARRSFSQSRILVCLAISSALCYIFLYRTQSYLGILSGKSVIDLKYTPLGIDRDHEVDSKGTDTQVQELPGPPVAQTPVPAQEHDDRLAPDDTSSMEQFWAEYSALDR